MKYDKIEDSIRVRAQQGFAASLGETYHLLNIIDELRAVDKSGKLVGIIELEEVTYDTD